MYNIFELNSSENDFTYKEFPCSPAVYVSLGDHTHLHSLATPTSAVWPHPPVSHLHHCDLVGVYLVQYDQLFLVSSAVKHMNNRFVKFTAMHTHTQTLHECTHINTAQFNAHIY